MQAAILIPALASLGALLVWMAWAAVQILQEEAPAQHATWVEEERMIAGQRPVRLADIRTREAERVSMGPDNRDYHWDEGFSLGWPEHWTEDLIARRN